MTLQRILEPEVMDSEQEAREYDAMDHSEVNRLLVEDLASFLGQRPAWMEQLRADSVDGLKILDVGTGTALIPIELCQRFPGARVLGIDMALSMLDLGRYNIEAASLSERIQLDRVDAKAMGYDTGAFDVVFSNSIVHHIPEPAGCLAEMDRVLRAGGAMMVRDLARPADLSTLDRLVTTYAGQETEYSRKLFRDSLHAALTLDEIRDLVQELGYDRDSVQLTSDRHWTWSAWKD